VPTDTAHAPTRARNFALRLIAWLLALFGVLRLPWIGVHVLLPMTQLQAAAGSALVGPSSRPIEATLACSGADALALCLAAIVAYPSRWRMRAAGIAGGAVLILALNTLRIGTLGRAAASPPWFDALHIYLWPAVLTLAIAGYVFAWMGLADRQQLPRLVPTRRMPSEHDWRMTRRFALVAGPFLLAFTLAAPLYLESARVLALAGFVARAAASLLRVFGMNANAAGGVLATPRGAFLVTQECISTPLIPIYFAAVLVYARPWRARVFWAVTGLPLFIGLGIARLLVVALPAGFDAAPAFSIHTFFQVLVAVGMVCGLAVWRYGARAVTGVRAIVALALGIAFVRWLGTPYTQVIFRLSTVPAYDDTQGALRFLPAFQLGLFLALWVAAFIASGYRRFLRGILLLIVTQIAVASSVHVLAVHADIGLLVRDIRVWALLGPALIIAAVVTVVPARR
jgi:exosortase/archaeosortase family protein